MEIETKVLKQAIDKMKPATKQNEISEFGQYLFITNNQLLAYNGAVCVIAPIKSELDVALPSNEFMQFVERISSKEITFESGDTIDVKAGRAKASFTRNDTILERAKDLNISVPADMKKLPKDFMDGLKLVRHSVGTDKTQRYMTYLKVEKNKLASTDNFRVSEYTMESEMEYMLLPQSVLAHMIKYDFTHYHRAEGVVYFKDKEDTYFVTRIGDTDFVEYEHLLNVKGDAFEFPENIMKMLSVGSITSGGITDVDKTVKIEIANKLIKVSSENEMGRVEVDETTDSKINATILVSSQFITDVLNVTRKCFISENLILFETDNFKQIVALYGNA